MTGGRGTPPRRHGQTTVASGAGARRAAEVLLRSCTAILEDLDCEPVTRGPLREKTLTFIEC